MTRAVALFVLLFAAEVRSETVDVKYRGPVDLKTFACTDTPRSSFIQRVTTSRGHELPFTSYTVFKSTEYGAACLYFLSLSETARQKS
jgi:hypothetical protein